MLGGCGPSGPAPATFIAEMTLPPGLSALSHYQASLTLYDSQGQVVTGPMDLRKSGPRSWSGEALEVLSGDYFAELQMSVGSPPTPLALLPASRLPSSLVPAIVLRQPLVIAIARRSFSFPGGTASTTLAFQPADFRTDMDQDGDGRANLSEYANGLDPFSNDSDQDGVIDGEDFFPLDVHESIDEDLDGVGNSRDNCPSVANPLQNNGDQDRWGDLCDPDRDNDGLSDADEVRLGSNPLQIDSDQDNLVDGEDNCPTLLNQSQEDADRDGTGDLCDADDDNDGITDTEDNCLLAPNSDQADVNRDHIGDACTNDDDGDGVVDDRDNCRLVANPDQRDNDRDPLGDACDPDDDNDGLTDEDEEGLGSDHMRTDALSTDTDADTIPDNRDNCPTLANANQADTDQDGDGDTCDCAVHDADIRIRDAVFVSAMRGNDGNSGAQNHPVRSLTRAIQIAGALGRSSLYVSEGSFDEAVSLPAGISLLGGFADAERCLYHPEAHPTLITNQEQTTIQVNVSGNDMRIADLTIQNRSAEGHPKVMGVLGNNGSGTLSLKNLTLLGFRGTSVSQAAQGLVVEGARVDAVNNVIVAGNGYATTGVEWHGVAGRFYHNTIHGGHAQYRSVGISIGTETSIQLINNILMTEHLGDFTPPVFDNQCVIAHTGSGWPSQTIAKGNLLKPFRLPESTEAPRFYCDFGIQQLFSIDRFNALDESLGSAAVGSIAGNLTSSQNFTDLFADSSNDDFHPLLGSDLLDVGVDPALEGWVIPFDHDGQSRPQGGRYDIGAYELH